MRPTSSWATAALLATLAAASGAAHAESLVVPPPNSVPAGTPNSTIFDPIRAPEIVIRIGARRLILVPRPAANGSGTAISSSAIEQRANSTNFSQIITSSVAGAAANANGEIHIRGSHGQYTYYLDGAPLPQSVSGSFADLIDPKNIETLRVYTGGFPAQYGGNIAAVFDVTSKAGQVGRPHGFAQQIVQGYNTYDSTVQAGGGGGRLTYFLSGVKNGTNRRLDPNDPNTPYPFHDAGGDTVVFGKANYALKSGDQLVLDTARTDSIFQIPDTALRNAIKQNDVQRENGNFGNLIFRHIKPAQSLIVAVYSHQSALRYDGDPAHDLAGTTDADAPTMGNPRFSAFENRKSTALGLRTDYTQKLSKRHKLGLGFDVSEVTGREKFNLYTNDGTNPISVVNDEHLVSGNDQGFYLQDDWTPGRFLINYGARYDIHKADTATSQLSPRVNVYYTANKREKFHAYYDRLFQPVGVEDVRKLDPNATQVRPERDSFYEIGWQHESGGIAVGFSAYYKTSKDVVDENVIHGTQIREPFNVQKGYVRGLELTTEGSLTRDLSFYANFARSWVKSAGDFTGGFGATGLSQPYFYADHDQTNTASMGLDYAHNGRFLSVDGEYGSGFPFGTGPDGVANVYRVSPHFITNLAIGTTISGGQIAFTVENVFNHPYVIKQADIFTDTEQGQTRTFGGKLTLNF